MTAYQGSSQQWTEASLQALPVENGFRLRGLEISRLDTLFDAALAFVLTLLVISFDEIPASHEEMLTAIKRVPGFAASFATLMMFWLQHRQWSRRYGLENTRTIVLTLTLIFVVLVYVYPLRILFESMFYSISGGFFPTMYRFDYVIDLRAMFVIYSSGFLAMSLLLALLFLEVLRNATSLALNEHEQHMTKTSMRGWVIAAIIGAGSIILALALPAGLVTLSGYFLFLLIPASWVNNYRARRRQPS